MILFRFKMRDSEYNTVCDLLGKLNKTDCSATDCRDLFCRKTKTKGEV